MFATIPVISPLFQVLLNAIGWVLAWLYQVVPNYGVAIIILTVLLRIVVLPLGIKQIKSMGAMQAIQPKLSEIKKKYKGNSQKIQEETMRLYKEAGVNPLGGCLPLLLQFPILIAMYAVIRTPGLEPVTYNSKPAYAVVNSHLPPDSKLFIRVLEHRDTTFVPGVDLVCSARDGGQQQVVISDTSRAPVVGGRTLLRDGQPVSEGGTPVTSQASFGCGSGVPSKIPYLILLALMIATTFYQQLQMQRVSPPGASSQQQQAILRIMPLMFGFIGFSFPAGLVLYWTIANVFMIGQQWALLRAGHIGPQAIERRIAEQRARQATEPDKPRRKGWIATMMERAQEERQRREPPRPRSSGTGGNRSGSPKGGGTRGGPSKGGTGKGGTSKGGTKRGGARGSNPRGSAPRRPPGGRPRPKRPETGGDGGS